MKKIVLTFALALVMQTKAFTQFEINITVPFGASFIIPYAEGSDDGMVQVRPYSIDYRGIEPAINLNIGVLMQIGGGFDLGNETGVTSISLLADLGYYLKSFGAAFKKADNVNLFPIDVKEEVIYLHTLNLGIIPKINISIPNLTPFSIGLGGGVKIPLSGTRYVTMYSRKVDDIEEKMSYKDIKETFEYPFIPYIKLTMDSSFYVSKSIALVYGVYFSYDFPMKYDVDKVNAKNNYTPVMPVLKLTEYGSSSFDVGVMFGISFGRPDPRPKKEAL